MYIGAQASEAGGPEAMAPTEFIKCILAPHYLPVMQLHRKHQE